MGKLLGKFRMETIDEKIGRFREFNEELLDVAQSKVNMTHEKVHSKILCCSIFDALSKSVFPDIKGNRQRYIELVRLCDQWPESQKVSLLHLVRLLEKEAVIPNKFRELIELSNDLFLKNFKLSNNVLSNTVPATADISFKELLTVWPKNKNGNPIQLAGVQPSQLKHENLFWCYRNSIVHEYRNPGNGVELGSSQPDLAFYQEVYSLDEKSDSIAVSSRWELIYPVNLFIKLCKYAIEIACNHHFKNRTSPFEAYASGTYWLPTFNEG